VRGTAVHGTAVRGTPVRATAVRATAARRTGHKAQRRGLGVAAGLALLLLTLAACGSPGTAASPTASSPATSATSAKSVGGYLGCLLRHAGGGPGSARQACASLRPADLAAELQKFESCLKAHGVAVPALPAQGRRAALVQFVTGLHAGSRTQRSALTSCSPAGISG
jgi:hypothetical protein